MNKFVYLDLERCVGCYACAVACMDQNDISPEAGDAPFRRVYKVECGNYPNATIQYVSSACMHCQDSPCLVGCPTGAITRNPATSAIVVASELCIGCHSCALACPFGIPRYDANGKLQKCNMCSARVANGLLPACVKVCPTDALRFGAEDEILGDKFYKFIGHLCTAANKTTSGK